MTVEAQPVMERVSARLPGMPRGLGRFIRRQPLGAAGALIIIAMALAAILAGPISPYDPLEVNYGAMFHRPGNEHWLGTDAYGRDVFSRIIYGSRTALLIGLSASFVGATMGALIGVISAYYGGTTDLAVQRIVDILISFPIIILAMAIVAITGTGLFKLIVAISLSMVPRCALVVRS
ncbi:MAG: ABC transporter permease, partial [Armatimonadetes bacterium]|nr:ABC transporter permease [Armatimonadota bacterium]